MRPDMIFASRINAINYAKRQLGHTVHYDTGFSGDCGYGSRLYFCAPDAPKNEFGVPQDNHSTVSLVGRRWFVSDFTCQEQAA